MSPAVGYLMFGSRWETASERLRVLRRALRSVQLLVLLAGKKVYRREKLWGPHWGLPWDEPSARLLGTQLVRWSVQA